MRATSTMALLCALQASSVSAFVAPGMAPSAALRVAKSPLFKSSTPKLAPSLAARPQPKRETALQAEAAAVGPISADDKRMFVRWSYILCLANSLVNSATLIQFDEVVMHMTGPSTKGPLFLASGLAAQGWHNLGTIGAFLVGCMFAGLATAKNDGDTPIKATAPTIIAAGLLLAISGVMAKNSVHSCLYIAACAGGMLNGLTSKMTTFRVSHVTGTVTDMGLLIGKGIGSTLEPALKLKLRDLCVLMGVWFVGGCTAFWMSSMMSVGRVMSLASVPVLLLGLKGLFHKN
eukprot:CAMPEP_0119538306 /NCGR_PEP_ID=MMETSP1344-20130328/50758_1 /TAXON_ID=236787 /ORGANISM="Florenciella parvula, Strain CCMP2471" /LENGTH=289 /DNA_ID=CAMNT_0007581135 /DNA_START=32 /DNA_END=901 /DNA_ORIENTATION=+